MLAQVTDDGERGMGNRCKEMEKRNGLRRKEEMLTRGQIRPDPVVESAKIRESERREFLGHAQIRSREQVTVSRDRLQYQEYAAPFDEAGERASSARRETVQQTDRIAGEVDEPAGQAIERSRPADPREHRRVTRGRVFPYVLQVIDELQDDAVTEQCVERVRPECA